MITREKAQDLFANYNNVNFKTAKEFVDYVFDLPTSTNLSDTYIPLAGTGTKYVTGNIKFKDPNGALAFFNDVPIPVEQAKISWLFDVLGITASKAGQTLRITAFDNTVIEGDNLRLAQPGGNLAFFSAVFVPQQSVANTLFITPVDLATCITAINALNGVVADLRTGVKNYGLFV